MTWRTGRRGCSQLTPGAPQEVLVAVTERDAEASAAPLEPESALPGLVGDVVVRRRAHFWTA